MLEEAPELPPPPQPPPRRVEHLAFHTIAPSKCYARSALARAEPAPTLDRKKVDWDDLADIVHGGGRPAEAMSLAAEATAKALRPHDSNTAPHYPTGAPSRNAKEASPSSIPIWRR
jgi:hypothetical protein